MRHPEPLPEIESIVRTPTPEELARYRRTLAKVERHAEEIKAQALEGFDRDDERLMRELTARKALDWPAIAGGLRQAREEAGLTLEQVAERCSRRFDADDMRHIERADHPAPTFGMLRQYAKAVGLRLTVGLEADPGVARDDPESVVHRVATGEATTPVGAEREPVVSGGV